MSTKNPRVGCIWLAFKSPLLKWQFIALEGIFHCQKITIFCNGNIYILSCTYINYKMKILKKRYQEKWENAYLSTENPRKLASLGKISEKIAVPPPDQILDPHLKLVSNNTLLKTICQSSALFYSAVATLNIKNIRLIN